MNPILIVGLAVVIYLAMSRQAKGEAPKIDINTAFNPFALPNLPGSPPLLYTGPQYLQDAAPTSVDGVTSGDEMPSTPWVPAPNDPILDPSQVSVPVIAMRANPGMNPKPVPVGIYVRYPSLIDECVSHVNEAATGLNVGLNSHWRPIGSVGEELSQHHIGAAVDAEGPDQEVFAARLEAKGWKIIRQSNAGQPYNHIHAQREAAGLLSRLGVTVTQLQEWAVS